MPTRCAEVRYVQAISAGCSAVDGLVPSLRNGRELRSATLIPTLDRARCLCAVVVPTAMIFPLGADGALHWLRPFPAVALPIYLRVVSSMSLVAAAIRLDVAPWLRVADPFLLRLASCGASIPTSLSMRISAAVRLASATILAALLRLFAVMGLCEGRSSNDKT